MFQTEILAIPQKFEKITCRIAARNNHYIVNSGIYQRLNGIINHRLMINGQQMFIGNFRQRFRRLVNFSQINC